MLKNFSKDVNNLKQSLLKASSRYEMYPFSKTFSSWCKILFVCLYFMCYWALPLGWFLGPTFDTSNRAILRILTGKNKFFTSRHTVLQLVRFLLPRMLEHSVNVLFVGLWGNLGYEYLNFNAVQKEKLTEDKTCLISW